MGRWRPKGRRYILHILNIKLRIKLESYVTCMILFYLMIFFRLAFLLFFFIIANVAATPSQITDIKHWTESSNTRIVVYLDKDTEFKYNALKKEKIIYVDLLNAQLGTWKKNTLDFKDSLVKKLRIANTNKKDLRIALHVDKYKDYKVFFFSNPYRIVIDVLTDYLETELDNQALEKLIATKLSKKEKVYRVVIDPGHGGRDGGTVGRKYKVKEKDVALAISKKICKKINSQKNMKCFLTRDRDKYLRLETRTVIANKKRADLFISIHLNYSSNYKTSGIQTFFLNMKTDRASRRLAARENAVRESDLLKYIKLDMEKTYEANESANCARVVHKEFVRYMQKYYKSSRDFGVKKALFYVLWGARMPSILLEVGFLSNAKEERLLRTNEFQERIANGVVKGIKKYLNLG